nr:hypothetical protein [Saprospiraceae bacterium]
TYLGSSDKLEEIFLKYKSNNFTTKSITNIFRYEIPTKGNFIGPGTILLNHKDFKRDKIFPSLIQRAIQKEFDIRSVFIEGEFYSLAIFSPKLSETIDFRDLYASKIIPRNIPFNLPQDIKDKLTLMAKELYLKFCSFDLIYSSSSEFIFIEVNPEGIVDWVSLYGNFNIAGILCQNLINNEKRRN